MNSLWLTQKYAKNEVCSFECSLLYVNLRISNAIGIIISIYNLKISNVRKKVSELSYLSI